MQNILNKILNDYPSFRRRQVQEAIYKNLISDWDRASNLPKDLKEKLKKEYPLEIKAEASFSKDKKTAKVLFDFKGEKVEAVLMRHQGRNTVCVSSQVGCPLNCAFCVTGSLGFKRNLEIQEIVFQVLFFARFLKNENKNENITNIVFMGMGEPFLNYQNVLGAIRFMHREDIFNLGARRFSISTIGIPEGIKKLAKEKLEINLAFSLHSPSDELRSKLAPINKKYPLKKIFEALDYYIDKTNRKIMIEYLMLKGVNDTSAHAGELASLLKGRLLVVNLISYNPGRGFVASSKNDIIKFKNILQKAGINTTERYRQGRDIQAACGQLAAGR